MDVKPGLSDNSSSNIFLTGCILFANLDFTGLMDYALKAVIGGLMWLLFKMFADSIERRRYDRPSQKPLRKKKETDKGFHPTDEHP